MSRLANLGPPAYSESIFHTTPIITVIMRIAYSLDKAAKITGENAFTIIDMTWFAVAIEVL